MQLFGVARLIVCLCTECRRFGWYWRYWMMIFLCDPNYSSTNYYEDKNKYVVTINTIKETIIASYGKNDRPKYTYFWYWSFLLGKCLDACVRSLRLHTNWPMFGTQAHFSCFCYHHFGRSIANMATFIAEQCTRPWYRDTSYNIYYHCSMPIKQIVMCEKFVIVSEPYACECNALCLANFPAKLNLYN